MPITGGIAIDGRDAGGATLPVLVSNRLLAGALMTAAVFAAKRHAFSATVAQSNSGRFLSEFMGGNGRFSGRLRYLRWTKRPPIVNVLVLFSEKYVYFVSNILLNYCTVYMH